MDPSLQALLARLDHLSDQFGELKEGVNKAIRIADEDPEMALTRARKVLEYVVRDVYVRRINEPPGTRPLDNLLQRLVKDGFFPDRLDAYANTIRKLGNVGTHTFGEKITVADVYQSLTQLMPILEWYFETEHPETVGQIPAQKPEPAKAKPAAPAPVAHPETKIAVVPKGLRSFDANDADFFLDLLPGARDKDGLPESIRFWKHRIEAKDEATFTVGVIYGPSGCGKSSLVKAGLLPRLEAHVIAVYSEATGDDTEARMLKGIRKRCSHVPSDLNLTGTIAALRQGQGQKVFIVLDQFEQWLHAKRGQQNTELAQALRQCDGDHVQCVVMVRDDFWLALTRFMNDLHIELLQGQNIALVDLFDLTHARNVLAAFGRAFGRVNDPVSKEQAAFLEQAVQGLSQDGRVISVRLALFAEMVKGKAWTPATLKEVSGSERFVVTFLEETFAASTALPQHRQHQKAAQAVLKALLPEAGSNIKGHMRSQKDLLEVSGYAAQPTNFDALVRILDGELRLITPTDPEGIDSENTSSTKALAGEKYYQLTHDYLVPSLRDWLTRKQKETRRGRVELLLADRSGVWNARPENRQLPSLWQWASIRWLTQMRNWTPPQQKMMRQAGRYYAVRGAAVGLLALATFTGLALRKQVIERQKAIQAAGLVLRVLDADTVQVPALIGELSEYRQWADPLLRQENDKSAASFRQQLNVRLALLPVDATQADYLFSRLLDAAPREVAVIRHALAPHKDKLLVKLWAVVETPENGKESQLLRAAAALALYDPGSKRWVKVQDQVADDLVGVPAFFLATWWELFHPVREILLVPLAVVCRDGKRRETEQSLATELVAAYAADQPKVLAEMLLDANEAQFAVIYPKFKEQGARGLVFLQGELSNFLNIVASDATGDAKEKSAKRQANAAVALLKLDQAEKVWPLLKHSPDPRIRSYLIHRFGPLGADAGALIKRLDVEPEVTIRRALILSLGEYGAKELAPPARKALLRDLQNIYVTAPDPGLHAACEWLLRQWKQDGWLLQINDEYFKEPEQRKSRLDAIKQLLASDKENSPPQWYVDGQGETLVVIPGPVEFLMGSPPTEAGREGNEPQHKKRIGRTFAIAAKSVTVEQYWRFNKSFTLPGGYAPTPDCPVVGISWYQAAEYCNWLSKQENIPEDQWCYEIKNGQVTKLRQNYLSLTGYRLPTEAEMEFATRAGTVTSRYFGETDELLPKYAWYQKNTQDWPSPVANLKPNDLGLFDVEGNVFTWCQESYQAYPAGMGEDKEDELEIKSTVSRVLRGGSFAMRASLVRSAFRNYAPPSLRNLYSGFRPARSFTP